MSIELTEHKRRAAGPECGLEGLPSGPIGVALAYSLRGKHNTRNGLSCPEMHPLPAKRHATRIAPDSTRRLAWIFCLLFASLAVGQTYAQGEANSRLAKSQQFFKMVSKLRSTGCIEDLPAPTMIAEPHYTNGLTNVISFKLPEIGSLPFSPDTVKSPFVITVVNDDVGSPALEFPRPVDLEVDSIYTEIIQGLAPGRRYSYTTALFLPVCKIDCEAVIDTTQLELYCSTYQDTVWSIQDTEAPLLQSLDIPQLDFAPVAGWWNQSTFDIRAELFDPAGVWQGFLYKRDRASTEWGNSAGDTTFIGSSSELGFVYPAQATVAVRPSLPDGYYEFRVEGKDASHTAESLFPEFELAGNGGLPSPEASGQISINIDTTPPTSVVLTCEQNLNTIRLTWTNASDPGKGIGVEGYAIYRDDELVETVAATETSFVDAFNASSPDADFVYQVQPFDSLGNVQPAGGFATCSFQVVAEISMVLEPEFTAGSTNQICWSNSRLIDSYTLFSAVNCDFTNAKRMTTSDTCFTVTGLQDGARYCYWVEAVDRHQRVVRSDTVASTQDATKPEITLLDPVDKKILSDGPWSTSRDVRLRLVASDVEPGGVEVWELFEDGQPASFYRLTDAEAEIDTTVIFSIQSDECQPVEIAARVTDQVGNRSPLSTFIVKLDETPPAPVSQVSCLQLPGVNGVQLDWTASLEPRNCSGLAGYRIFRNGNLVSTLAPGVTSHNDLLPAETPSGQLVYQIQPFDSLDNVADFTAEGSCDYVGTSRIDIAELPEFTPGLTSEICWTASSGLVFLKVFLDENSDFTPDDSLLVLSPPASQMCYTFTELKDGQRYAYWVAGVDEQQRAVNSDTVQTVQDNSRPVVEFFTLPRADTLNGQFWAYDRNVEVNLVAQDTAPGEIWAYEIFQDNQSVAVVNLANATSRINTLFSYAVTLQARQLTRTSLAARVIDGAGNVSDLRSIRLNIQERIPQMFAFPNPFNPMKNRLTIRLDDTDEAEVKVFDFFGNLVRTLDGKVNSRDFVWDGKNGAGETVASGGYVAVGTKTKSRFKIGVVKKTF